MSFWEVRVTRGARRELKALDEGIQLEAAELITSLEDDAFPPGSLALRGTRDFYRIRLAGAYRVVYRVNERQRRVMILRIRQRGDVYEGLDRW